MDRQERKGVTAFLRRKLLGILPRLSRLWGVVPELPVGEVTMGAATWRVEVAMTAWRRRVGLSGRAHVPAGTGMLFVYPRLRMRRYTMRGCLVPLDIAFLSATLEVVSTHTMLVEPGRAGRKHYDSPSPARYVLEVPAGEFARAGVRAGSRAELSANIPSPLWAEPWP